MTGAYLLQGGSEKLGMIQDWRIRLLKLGQSP